MTGGKFLTSKVNGKVGGGGAPLLLLEMKPTSRTRDPSLNNAHAKTAAAITQLPPARQRCRHPILAVTLKSSQRSGNYGRSKSEGLLAYSSLEHRPVLYGAV